MAKGGMGMVVTNCFVEVVYSVGALSNTLNVVH